MQLEQVVKDSISSLETNVKKHEKKLQSLLSTSGMDVTTIAHEANEIEKMNYALRELYIIMGKADS